MNKYVDKLMCTAPANSAVRAALSIPFPRKRLAQILDEARDRQLAEIIYHRAQALYHKKR